MSNENVSVQKFLDLFNIKSTRFILLVFTVATLVLLLIFFFWNQSGRRHIVGEIESFSNTKNELTQKKNVLEKGIINSFNKSLLYNQSSKESDRFQTIYALKNTKNLYEDYFESCALVDDQNELDELFISLRTSLTSFDLLIAESINADEKVSELITDNQNPEDTVSQFLFKTKMLGTEAAELKAIETSLSEIQNQLFSIENQTSNIINQKIKELNSESHISNYIVFGLIFYILIFTFSALILKRIRFTVASFSKILNDISRGALPDTEIKSEREFKPLIDSSNEIAAYLNDASQFAIHIGNGEFGFELKPKSENDALGNSLIEMRNRLQQVTREDKIRNWINEGQAKFGEIMRHNNDLKELGDALINNLVEYLNANQGALFVLKEEEDHEYLELLSTYAFNRKKFVEKKLQIGEGLAGQAFTEGKSIYLKDIKTDHYNIVTGLGESKPTSLLIVPLKEEDKIEGIVEIASFEEIKTHEIQFIESIGESIASSLNAGKVNETTRRLLEETQEKAEQMKSQEEELRQNMEELAATQEQMERRNKELEEIQEKFDQERYLLNALLNSSNDRIYFKDMESKFIRVSKSMVDLFEKQDESEVLGKSDFDFGFEEHAKVAFEDEQRIIKTGNPMEDLIEKEQWDDGRVTWVSTTKNPLKDLEGKTIGTFGISRDITKSKLTELEMQKRKDWLETFFKFETIGFVVIDQWGKVAFATPQILSKLGKEDSEQLEFEDIFTDKKIEDFLVEIKHDTIRDEKIEVELKFNNKIETVGNFMVVSGSKENDDGTFNIFIIQK